MAFKIQLYAPTGKGIRLRNYSITGTPAGGGGPSPVATTTTINSSGITNRDVYLGTAAGSLSATVTPAGSAALVNPTITWSSSNTGVATIESNGTVTLRDRDTMEQITLKVEEVKDYVLERIVF